MKTAVILAAGMGTRLRSVLKDVPKGFLEINDVALIDRSINILHNNGFDKIIIVTGHLSDHYNEYAKNKSYIETIHNKDFAISGSMYSLYTAKDLIDDDFLLLESDLIYETEAIKTLLNTDKKDAILLSGITDYGDEVFIDTDNDSIVGMSKNIADIKNIGGVLVGISKLSKDFFAEMVKIASDELEKTLKYDYEDCIVAVGNKIPIRMHKIENLIWAEVDDENHLNIVKDKIIPRLIEKEDL